MIESYISEPVKSKIVTSAIPTSQSQTSNLTTIMYTHLNDEIESDEKFVVGTAGENVMFISIISAFTLFGGTLVLLTI